MHGLPLDLPAGSTRYPDAGYPDCMTEGILAEASGCRQQSARKENSKRPTTPPKTC